VLRHIGSSLPSGTASSRQSSHSSKISGASHSKIFLASSTPPLTACRNQYTASRTFWATPSPPAYFSPSRYCASWFPASAAWRKVESSSFEWINLNCNQDCNRHGAIQGYSTQHQNSQSGSFTALCAWVTCFRMDLKSVFPQGECGFNSHPGHHSHNQAAGTRDMVSPDGSRNVGARAL
jgi:hypothetical protein